MYNIYTNIITSLCVYANLTQCVKATSSEYLQAEVKLLVKQPLSTHEHRISLGSMFIAQHRSEQIRDSAHQESHKRDEAHDAITSRPDAEKDVTDSIALPLQTNGAEENDAKGEDLGAASIDKLKESHSEEGNATQSGHPGKSSMSEELGKALQEMGVGNWRFERTNVIMYMSRFEIHIKIIGKAFKRSITGTHCICTDFRKISSFLLNFRR